MINFAFRTGTMHVRNSRITRLDLTITEYEIGPVEIEPVEPG